MARPDQSFFLAHFTKDGSEFDPHVAQANPSINQMSAFQRPISILENKSITATSMNWTNKDAVCFTECPWSSLLRHAENYSSYGVGFTKKLVYSRGGNPVIYANPAMFRQQHWSPAVYPFVTPFVPTYATDSVKQQPPFNGRAVDYSHEREWRVIKDFPFQYSYISFVILEKVNDLKEIPSQLIEEIGIEKFLYMDIYRKIEELWPTHVMD